MNRRQRRKLQSAAQFAQPSNLANEPQPPAVSTEVSHTPAAKPGHSTGPRTEEGKTASSRNAFRHGLCSRKLTGGDLEDLNAIRARLDEEWEPQTETENMLLSQMALSQWRLERAFELELAALNRELETGEIDAAALTLALRYRVSAERTFFKSLAELQRLRAAMRQDALRELQRQNREDKAIIRQLEHQVLGSSSNFVSQNSSGFPSQHQFVSQNPESAKPETCPRA